MKIKLLTLLLTTVLCALKLSGAAVTLPLKNGEFHCQAMMSKTGMIPPVSPRFRFALTEKKIKITFQVPGKAGSAGGGVFSGEVFEFLLAPDAKGKDYFHFAVAPEGKYYTAKCKDSSVKLPLAVKVFKKSDHWGGELTIPRAAVKLDKVHENMVIRANFAATLFDNGVRRVVSWNPAATFHDLSTFGKITFSDNRQQIFAEEWSIKNGILQVKLNLPPAYKDFPQTLTTDRGSFTINKSNSKEKVLSYTLFDPRSQPVKFYSRFTVTVKDTKGKTVFTRSGEVTGFPPNFLKLDRFYYPVKSAELKFEHNFGKSAALKVCDQAGRLRLQLAPLPARGKLDISKLPPGSYRAEVRNPDTRTFRSFIVTPENFSAPAINGDAALGIRDGKLMLGNTPVFAVGGSSTARHALQFTPCFNLRSGDYGLLNNAIDLEGLPLWKLIRQPETGFQLLPDWESRLQHYLARNGAAKRKLSRLGYEAQLPFYDSAAKRGDGAKFHTGLYRRMKVSHPAMLFSIHVDDEKELSTYLPACDILECACWSSSFAEALYPNAVRDMRQVRKLAKEKPVIFWVGVSVPDNFTRTAEELRFAAYCAMICDLNGVIFHLGHGGISAGQSRLWSVVSGINAELGKIYPSFAAGTPMPELVKSCKGNFLYAVRKLNNQLIVAVVNLSPAEQKLRMLIHNRNINDIFTPLEAKIFYCNY
ncbi:MAG: hypothetical protein IKC89_03865 [Lentisphaeria bacterium]|nr:hypothetical protein [Lentisphaeria bacterium]